MEAINWRHPWNNDALQEDIMKEMTNHGFLSGGKIALALHKNVDDDTVSFSTYRHAILSPKFRHSAYLALRITLLVAFPLMLIGERYKNVILLNTLLALLGIANSRDTLGEQIADIIMTIQVQVWVTVWGVLMYACGVISKPIAWWFCVFLAVFVLALFGDLPCRRRAILMTVFMMAIQLANPDKGYMLPLNLSGDVLFSQVFTLIQALIPPFMMNKRVDKEMACAFLYVGEVLRNASKACWSQNPAEAAEALTKTTLRPLRAALATLPSMLDVARYEPVESTLRWQLRKERMDLLRNLMPMLYALSGVSHELNFLQQSKNHTEGDAAGMLNSNSLIDEVLRGRLDEVLQPFLDSFEATVKELCHALAPTDVVAKVPFDDLKETTSQLQSAIDKLHFDVMSLAINPVEPVWYMHIVFAHLMMVLLGEELLKYFELMRNFDRTRYHSASRCMLNFFFLEYWNDFCQELPKRVTLATPRDVRLAKDAFKLAVAYTLGCFFSLYIDRKNPYYFGMLILMGVGLPTAGDTLVAGMQRVAGLLFAITIAYLVNKYHQNEYDRYVYALSAVTVSLFTRVFPAYLNCSIYCSILISPMLMSQPTPEAILSRLVSNSLTVMAYYAIVVFVFPIDTIKVLHNTEVKVMNSIADNLAELMDILNLPFDGDNSGVKEQLSAVKNRISELWATVRQVSQLIRTAAGEPIIRGSPYPVHEQDEFEPVLHHLVASLDIIALGLSFIHRQRPEAVERELEEVISSLGSPVQHICVYSMCILQDFVDTVQIPKKWSYSQAVKHFSALMQLNNELKEVFGVTHQNIMAAIRGKAKEIRVNNLKQSMRLVASMDRVIDLSELSVEHLPFGISAEPDDMSCQGTEREELTAPRNASFLLRPEEFTINHDMNMSIAILVGIDLFCTELEKMLRIMLHLNKFELDRRYNLHKKKGE